METTTFDIIGMARRVDSNIKRRRTVRVVAGIGIAAVGIARAGVLGPLLVLAGTVLVTRGFTDKPLKETLQRLQRWFEGPHTHHFGNGKRDLVDEASWQSFPASDPPGYSAGKLAGF